MKTCGQCLCGAVRYETDGSRNWSCYCHCESCRRNCAAPVAAFFGVSDGHWRWTGAPPSTYVSSNGVTRYFCATCGTPMAYAAETFPGEIHFYATTLENPQDFSPEFHVHHAESLPWMEIRDDLPRHPGKAEEGESE